MFGVLVIGAPGAGKSTFCAGLADIFDQIHRPHITINLDPANDFVLFKTDYSIKEMITVEDAMTRLGESPCTFCHQPTTASILAKNAPARIVFTSSICHDWYPLDFSDLQAKQYGDNRGYLQYSRSKLLNHMTALKMARDKSDGVNVNVYEPGVIETKLLKAGGYSGSSVTDSGYAAVQLTTSDGLTNISGEYFNNKVKKASSSADAKDVAQQDRLWKMSEEVCAKFGITF
ncbi:unnamed protein product [Cylicocyclus nassatus]|uniref:Uncharacterized protein n=1 Tax=Cylicocyclus nassatus TaxID=53992 RepID=A0AA36DL81_CYLNA|nr:unnamed protein product [Cylicocyclus nassatus]